MATDLNCADCKTDEHVRRASSNDLLLGLIGAQDLMTQQHAGPFLRDAKDQV